MFLQSIRRGLVPQPRPTEPREIPILVRGGYQPARIVARAGETLRLKFRREDRLACTEQVVFPAFGRSATLPSGEDVIVELHLPERSGEYEFTCGLGMLRGTLVVVSTTALRK